MKAPAVNGYDGEGLTLGRLLGPSARYEPRNKIFYQDHVSMDYHGFIERVHRLGSALKELGVKSGDVVAVLDWDSHRYLEAFFAVPMLGAVLHTVNIRLSPEQILYTMEHARDRFVLVHEDFLPLINAIKDRLGSVQSWVLLRDGKSGAGDMRGFAGEYENLLEQGSSRFEFPNLDENQTATTFYTTGTTGTPKGVSFTHRQLVLHSLAVGNTLSVYNSPALFSTSDVYMPLTPMFHVHAWGIPYVAAMHCNTQVYPGRYDPETILELIKKHSVSFSHCVPTILSMVLNHPKSKEVDLSGWKVVIGGSALSQGLAEAAMERGIDIFTGYGMSETCPVLTLASLRKSERTLSPDQQIPYRRRAGIPIPFVDLKIEPQGNEKSNTQQHLVGEILVRSPWLTQGYIREPEASKALWQGGWLHTGDVGFIDSEGYLNITDRVKDVIKTGGEWVSSLELESLISRYDGVLEAAVVGVPDSKWGERPVAIVVSEAGKEIKPEDIQDHLKQFVKEGLIQTWAIPEKIEFVEDLPKTSVGKVDKKLIRAGL